MLIEFSVENYKSFRERVTLSMLAANLVSEDKKLDEDNVFEAAPGVRLLRSAAIYGANASGKSNLAAAFKFMRTFVLNSVNSTQPTEGIGVEPFLLNTASAQQPSSFEVVFVAEGKQYRYGFEVTKREVVSEWLFVQLSSKETSLFTREGTDIKCGRAFKEGHGLEQRTRPNSLFLSVVAQFNGRTAVALLGWFTLRLAVSGLHDAELDTVALDFLENETLRPNVVQFVGAMDLGIRDLMLAMDEVSRQTDHGEDVQSGWGPRAVVSISAKVRRPKAVHSVRNTSGSIVDQITLDLSSESQGTRKLVTLAPALLWALRLGYLLFIDEFDARLHPIISRAIISMFNDPNVNRGNGQLIAITHDTNLLDKSLFRRDQIWFVEKDERDESHLTSLAEFRVKNDAAYEKNYLQGRYSAIPYLGDLTALPKVKDAA